MPLWLPSNGGCQNPRCCHHGFVSTAIVVAVVAGLMLLGIGMVINQLLRLRRYLGDSPTVQPPGTDADPPPDPPTP
ncbi:hypothetical protein A5659_25515 [Mycobacterium sp. 1165196.3]|nr:hypothetical protein A5624_25410 [Mycobacterium sp. 1482292.6]OBJ21233.1 hypothetical protein A5622_17950 [Mycobacterium sp. 1245801.1]OBK02556.1 hypothetical protein A9W96_01515 [Mycobacterium sp. 1245852.3]OBK31774.1 hypothetical protein A5659_25515 [Mycobacterium sp. 1165196.3]OBL03002.1 hypothetical protein A5646_17840 [Mycobacterium sp. 1245499.0]